MKNYITFLFFLIIISCQQKQKTEISNKKIYYYDDNNTQIEGIVKEEVYVKEEGNIYGGVDTITMKSYLLSFPSNITVYPRLGKETEYNVTTNGVEAHIFADNINFSELINKNVKFEGTFFMGHTAHHRRPLVFEVSKIIE